ncbi:MAG: class I SAM-dependent methyltransferase [Nitrospira sp.]|nr:class I SAM-dependent methyltransferase [Nitrospira sp.]
MGQDKAAHYDLQYQKENYFGYREWLYDRYIAGLIDVSGLNPGATVLDVGCGQGFFSYLFSKHGMVAHGIDISEVGIRAAQRTYGHRGVSFSVADIASNNLLRQFDCVFARGLSLYNRPDFSDNIEVTKSLLRLVKPTGVLMFLYYSNCSSKRSDSWRYHSWSELQSHFRQFQGARFYFSFKIDTFLFGRYAFTKLGTQINMLMSKVTRKGGDLICLVNKSPAGS